MIKQFGTMRLVFFFGLFLIFAAGLLGYIFKIGDQSFDIKREWIDHSYEVIEEAKDISLLTEAMLASQRAYILTGDKKFISEYKNKKQTISEHIKSLTSLVNDNKEQTARINIIQREMRTMARLLEKRIYDYDMMGNRTNVLDDVVAVNASKEKVLKANNAVLQNEYDLLNGRLESLQFEKESFYSFIAIGGTLVVLLVFAFNAGIVYLISRKSVAERMLKDSEDRFVLASEGANDGIFDWDLQTDRVFYSRQFFAMLGMQQKAFVGTSKDFRKLIHPEDEPQVWQYIESYLHHELSEYSNTYRMKHADGRWVWVNSRAKAIFDDKGTPLRMVGANSDITYMKEYQEKLKEEKLRAENANRAKGEFLAHMSHEIRTPLTAISGIAEIFQRNTANLDDKQKQLVKTLYTSTASLKDLISDILDFSKIESGEMELNKDHFLLNELFQEVISIMSVQANEKGLVFRFDFNGLEALSFFGDKVRLRQVLINIIGNAIKFTEAGRISVDVMREDIDGQPCLVARIADTGVGIAPEHMDLIFERFKQADASVSRRRGGSGLGLSISRNLINLMGGDIEVKSEFNKGSVFTVTVPWQVSQRSSVGMATSKDDMPHKVKAALDGENRILMVEDYEGNIVVVSYILEELNCAYDIARNGVEALRLWKEHRYDAILMDVQMPEMDGFTATSMIRGIEQQKGLPRTPIIGMTAHALVGDKSKCIEAGMDAYLPKPIVEADLKAEILKYLSPKQSSVQA